MSVRIPARTSYYWILYIYRWLDSKTVCDISECAELSIWINPTGCIYGVTWI